VSSRLIMGNGGFIISIFTPWLSSE
jgi:hypothetical protein